MASNVQRTHGRGQGYKLDRGGMPTEMGPFIGTVKNNVDPSRQGRLQVHIEQFVGGNADDPSQWRTVSYIPPFYGVTPQSGTDTGVGTYVGNPNSYGMWFTPPDLETQVICFFVAGDPNQGYYIGCVPQPGVTHMIPAVAASTKYQADNAAQKSYFNGANQVPVTEINDDNSAISENPRFFDAKRPVHSFVAGQMIQQGLIKDVLRGPITSTSQRESPSAVFGISTPGRAIYADKLDEKDIKAKLESGSLKPNQVIVKGRRGGHSIVMDDGDLQGYDRLMRFRTAKGHQITMSDDGDCFYIIHANGQTWIEFGSEGTVDVYATNSVNVRTEGEINLHADKSINMYAKESINMKSQTVKIEAVDLMELISTNKMNIYASTALSVMSDGTLALRNASQGGWDSGGPLNLKGSTIDLNGAAPPSADRATPLEDIELPDTAFIPNVGWQESSIPIKTIVSRAPTHEPYPYHNRGVNVKVSLAEGSSGQEVTQNETLPPDVTITRIS